MKDIVMIAGFIGTSIAGGWIVDDRYESKKESDAKSEFLKEKISVAESKADYAMDKHMEYLVSQIAQIQEKIKKEGATVAETEQLKYLRDELERLRAIRRGKT